MRRTSLPKKHEKIDSFYVRYPGPTLAIAMLVGMIFTLGGVWATANARIQRLEEITNNFASKEELNTIKALIQGLSDKMDILIKKSH